MSRRSRNGLRTAHSTRRRDFAGSNPACDFKTAVRKPRDSAHRRVLPALRSKSLGGSLQFPIRCWRSALPSSSTRRLRDRRHQWRWPKKVCAISRPIPQPNPCTTDRMSPEPCWGAKTAIAPTARPARMKSLMKVLLELEVGRTGPRGRRDREAPRRNTFVAPSHARAAGRSPRRPH